MEFTVTRAETGDRQAVIELSSHFTDDYLEHTVDRWIGQEKGGLYLVWDAGLLIGCCSLYFPSSAEAWLQGMRVRPGYQGRGIAYQLNRYLIEQAQTGGAAAVRLLTHQNNHQALKVAQKLGFSAAGGQREIIFRRELKPDALFESINGPVPRLCKTSEYNRAAYFLNNGPSFHNLQGFLFGPGFSYRRFTRMDLKQGINNKQVYLFEERNQVRGILFVLRQKHENHLIISYLDAPLKNLPTTGNLFKTWHEEGFDHFTVNMITEQHQVLKPSLKKLLGDYECEQLLLMEKYLIPVNTNLNLDQ